MPDSETSTNGDDKPVFGARYYLQTKLGAGGMGAVYRAEDKVLKKTVAVKVLLSNLQAEAMIRFHQEAKTTARLGHKNILNVLDFGQAKSGELYLVMDYLDGRSLADILKANGPMEPSLAVPIFCQICDGLAHAHNQGILHRDIKPSNVMIVDDGRGFMQAKIVDFGLAKMEASEQSLTTTGARVGSPLYMSPEQCHGREVDHRSDIYSLGILMYRTLTGAVPFQGDSYLETLSKHVNEDPRDINHNERDLEFSPELAAIVSKTLEKDPGNRYQTCEELLAALQALDMTEVKPSRSSEEEHAGDLLFDTARSAQQKRTRKFYVAGIAAAALTLIGATCYVVNGLEPAKKPEVKVRPARQDILKQAFAEDIVQYVDGGKKWIKIFDCTSNDSMAILFKNHPDIKNLNFMSTPTRGKHFSELIGRNITNLDVSCTYVKDEVLPDIGKLTSLEGLWLNGDRITDVGLKPLVYLPELKELGLRNTEITDRALELISEMKALEILDISDCKKVTGKGLRALAKSKSLHTLQIANCTGMTSQDIERFKADTGVQVMQQNQNLHPTRIGWNTTVFAPRHDEGRSHDMSWVSDMGDPNFQKFWQNPKNWDLNKDEVAKLPPNYRKYYEDPKYAEYRKDPRLREKWTKQAEWDKFTEMTDMVARTAISAEEADDVHTASPKKDRPQRNSF